MTQASDADLMAGAALGDRGAIATLYDRHAAVLLGVALRVVGRPAEAEDVLHDVFVSLPARAKYYASDRGSVIAWLAILVRNAGIDRIRRYGAARQAAGSPDQIVSEEDAAPDPERSAMASSVRHLVRRALAALPSTQRASLEAAFFEGLTYAQIAERDGVPLNTVKSRCARALIALREVLAEAGPEGGGANG